MAKGAQSSGKLIASDIESIAKASTAVNGSEFTAVPLEVWDLDTVVLSLYATGGHASASGNVEFKIVGSVDGDNWDTEALVDPSALVIALNGTSKVQKSYHINVLGLHSIRLQQVENKDSSYAATNVNVRWGKSFGGDQF